MANYLAVIIIIIIAAQYTISRQHFIRRENYYRIKVCTVITLTCAKKLIFDYEKAKEQQINMKSNLGAFYRYVNKKTALFIWSRYSKKRSGEYGCR